MASAKRGSPDTPVVLFKILSTGQITDARVAESSGFFLFDKAALDALVRVAPLERLPDGAPESVDIQFTFDYHPEVTSRDPEVPLSAKRDARSVEYMKWLRRLTKVENEKLSHKKPH